MSPSDDNQSAQPKETQNWRPLVVHSIMGTTLLPASDPKLLKPIKNSFPDENGKPIRCTSYGQALFSLPGSRLNPIELSNQAMKPINQL